VNLSILKFLGFEQVLKNSLTTLPMGGAKGGADFDPKGKTETEVMRFCHAFMSELHRHIGKNVDIPAGDIGVGSREIGYLFGQYKRIRNEFTGAMTGKGVEFGGSPIRAEATGYGCVYFAEEMLGQRGDTMEGKVCLVSGAGNVAQYAAQKLIDLGARVVTLSDRGGTVHAPDGLTQDHVDAVIELRTVRRGNLDEFAAEQKLEYIERGKPWQIPGDLAFPCATQNEVQDVDAQDLIDNRCVAVSEGANMPVSLDASRMFEEARVLHGAGKAANAGGVAISGLEMTQNSMRLTWDREEVDRRLRSIMQRIHEQCLQYGQVDGDDEYIDYVKGANVGGFRKVAEAMLAYGVM
jgi:glutamate dehydrogenase (NADP+)